MRSVMIVAGESSGDLYGSFLARELRKIWPDIRLFGIGGKRMQEEGVELIGGLSHAFGLFEVLSSIGRIKDNLKKAKNVIDDIRPSLCVLIDYPDFNFRLGHYAKKRGIKVLYYVSPQVWAWRKGRIKKMKEVADRIAVILPFEEELYKREGIEAEFVGHPVIEEIRDKAESTKMDAPFSQDLPLIALLPGSRPSELKRHLPVFNELAILIKKEFNDHKIALPLAPDIDASEYKQELARLERNGVIIKKGDAIGILARATVAVIASGTATLQSALLGVPMIVIYKLSLPTYLIGRAILDIKHISLVNILSGKAVVPELIQSKARPDLIMEELRKILSNDHYRNEMVVNLRQLKAYFNDKYPSKRIAHIIGEMAVWF